MAFNNSGKSAINTKYTQSYNGSVSEQGSHNELLSFRRYPQEQALK